MSQPQSIEEIMQRLRAQIQKPAESAEAKATPQDNTSASEYIARAGERMPQLSKNTGSAAVIAAAEVRMPEEASIWHPKFHELYQLRIETQTALDGSRQTGQLNPRNSGPINALIQFVKKVMRRSLTWYTRPLHHFQAGVIRALQQVVAILDNYRDQIQKLADRYNLQTENAQRRQSEVVFQLESYKSSLEEVHSQLSLQSTRSQQLSDRVDSLSATQEVRFEELRSASAETGQRAVTQFEELQALLHAQRSELDAQKSELRSLMLQLREAGMAQRVRERDLRRIVHAVEQSGTKTVQSPSAPVPAMFPSDAKAEFQFDYFAFEELYRGDESDIRQRQRAYLDYYLGRSNVADIGCGRGEFLELLRENGITARGIELGTDQYLLCKEKGLDVVQADLFEFLESVPDNSLGGIFSAQVIEHMTASDQLRYIALAYQKTSPGSPVLFETINPECVYAFVKNFFLDPTHVRPIHPETLRFAMESSGFANVELRYSGPASDKQIPPLQSDQIAGLDRFNAAMSGLNNFLFGYQDYAAIGWR